MGSGAHGAQDLEHRGGTMDAGRGPWPGVQVNRPPAAVGQVLLAPAFPGKQEGRFIAKNAMVEETGGRFEV